MARKVWNDEAGRHEKRGQAALPLDPFAPIEPAGFDLTKACTICNAKPGERCSSIVNAKHTRDVPHHTRKSPV